MQKLKHFWVWKFYNQISQHSFPWTSKDKTFCITKDYMVSTGLFSFVYTKYTLNNARIVCWNGLPSVPFYFLSEVYSSALSEHFVCFCFALQRYFSKQLSQLQRIDFNKASTLQFARSWSDISDRKLQKGAAHIDEDKSHADIHFYNSTKSSVLIGTIFLHKRRKTLMTKLSIVKITIYIYVYC